MAKKCRHRSRSYPARKKQAQKLYPGKGLGLDHDPDNNPLTEGESNTCFLTDEAEAEAWANLVGRKNVAKMARIFRGGNH